MTREIQRRVVRVRIEPRASRQADDQWTGATSPVRECPAGARVERGEHARSVSASATESYPPDTERGSGLSTKGGPGSRFRGAVTIDVAGRVPASSRSSLPRNAESQRSHQHAIDKRRHDHCGETTRRCQLMVRAVGPSLRHPAGSTERTSPWCSHHASRPDPVTPERLTLARRPKIREPHGRRSPVTLANPRVPRCST